MDRTGGAYPGDVGQHGWRRIEADGAKPSRNFFEGVMILNKAGTTEGVFNVIKLVVKLPSRVDKAFEGVMRGSGPGNGNLEANG